MLRKPTKNCRRGAAAVEFGSAPIFFLFVFALFEFTWTNVLRHTADNAAYEAALRRDGAGRHRRGSDR